MTGFVLLLMCAHTILSVCLYLLQHSREANCSNKCLEVQGHCRGNAVPSGSLRVGKGQHDPELRNALHMLSRNVAALLAHTAGPTLHKLPSDLNDFAKLERMSAGLLCVGPPDSCVLHSCMLSVSCCG